MTLVKGYDEWLLKGSEPKKSNFNSPEDDFDIENKGLCLYCYKQLPENHPFTVCDNCYPTEENNFKNSQD